MDFAFPLAAIVSEATAKTVDKLNFKRNHIAANHLMRLVFVGMTLTLGIYVVVAGIPVPDLSIKAAAFLVIIGLVSFAGNVFDYLSLKADDLSLREPMIGFEPVLAGLFGYLFFPGERKPIFLIGLALATVLVYFGSHRRRLGKNQRQGMSYLVLAVILYALLPSIYKMTLPYIGPEYIALFRVATILLLASVFMPIKRHTRSPKKFAYGLLSGSIYAVGTVTSLYAIDKLGVVQTAMLLLLAPALTYLSSYLILREKVRAGEVVASAGLIVVVLVPILLAG